LVHDRRDIGWRQGQEACRLTAMIKMKTKQWGRIVFYGVGGVGEGWVGVVG